MKKFVIVSDSCCDLGESKRKLYDIDYIPMHIAVDGHQTIADLDWKEYSIKEYCDILRSGKRIITAQITAKEYKTKFEEYINNGYDVLSISCSSALSASVKASYLSRDELKIKYPDSKIICIDALISCGSLGLLLIYASKLRSEGKSIEEVAEKIESAKWKMNQLATVSDLKYLKASGRISASKAFFGSVFNVKPIIVSSLKGENVSVEKTKGRDASIRLIAEKTAKQYVGGEIEGIYVTHADCLEDAEKLKSYISELLPNVEVTIDDLGPIITASSGPGMVASYFMGSDKPITE